MRRVLCDPPLAISRKRGTISQQNTIVAARLSKDPYQEVIWWMRVTWPRPARVGRWAARGGFGATPGLCRDTTPCRMTGMKCKVTPVILHGVVSPNPCPRPPLLPTLRSRFGIRGHPGFSSSKIPACYRLNSANITVKTRLWPWLEPFLAEPSKPLN